MIIKLDHYRKSKTRALVESYYAQPALSDDTPVRELAKVLSPAWRVAPRLPDNSDSIATPETS